MTSDTFYERILKKSRAPLKGFSGKECADQAGNIKNSEFGFFLRTDHFTDFSALATDLCSVSRPSARLARLAHIHEIRRAHWPLSKAPCELRELPSGQSRRWPSRYNSVSPLGVPRTENCQLSRSIAAIMLADSLAGARPWLDFPASSRRSSGRVSHGLSEAAATAYWLSMDCEQTALILFEQLANPQEKTAEIRIKIKIQRNVICTLDLHT